MSLLHLLQVLVLAIVQGAAELLPVSSSAHVTVAARLLGYDTSRVFEWGFLLVMLHTGTMFSVLIYFRSRWVKLMSQIPALAVATVCTFAIALPIVLGIEKFVLHGEPIEHLFQNLPLMACSLATVGVLIIVAGQRDQRSPGTLTAVDPKRGALIGVVQGLALPFRGFSRSGSTISAAMLLDVARARAEEFSFALAVILTPAVIGREALKLLKEHGQAVAEQSAEQISVAQLLLPGLLGMVLSFAAGLVALRWLSDWLEEGRWKLFGYYCLVAACAVLTIHFLDIDRSYAG